MIVQPTSADWDTVNFADGLLLVDGHLAQLEHPELWCGCVAAWSHALDQHPFDYSGGNQIGTRVGGISDVAGSWLFDGSSGYIDLGGYSVAPEPLTMCAFVRTVSGGGGRVISFADDNGINIYQGLRIVADGGITAQTGNGQQFFNDQTFSAVASSLNVVGELQHVCGVWDTASSRKIYVDGIEEGSQTSMRTATGHDVLAIGLTADAGDDEFFGGWIDDVRVYCRAIPDWMIETLAARPNIAYEARKLSRVFLLSQSPSGFVRFRRARSYHSSL